MLQSKVRASFRAGNGGSLHFVLLHTRRDRVRGLEADPHLGQVLMEGRDPTRGPRRPLWEATAWARR